MVQRLKFYLFKLDCKQNVLMKIKEIIKKNFEKIMKSFYIKKFKLLFNLDNSKFSTEITNCPCFMIARLKFLQNTYIFTHGQVTHAFSSSTSNHFMVFKHIMLNIIKTIFGYDSFTEKNKMQLECLYNNFKVIV